jgi:broad specificity phosphatase PhoE
MPITCPNWEHPANKLIADILGKGRGTTLYSHNGEKMPTPVQAIKQLYPNRVFPTANYETMDFGSWAGKYEPDYEKKIEDFILNHPDTPINGGDSFNGFLTRSLGHFNDLLNTAPNNTVVVTHSSVLKAIRLWDEAGRPQNLRLNNKDYVKEETQTGSVEKFKSKNGYIYVVRHGQTFDNLAENLRSRDTKLTDKGIQQAIDAGKELAGIQISKLYCSPLDRAIHTTDLIMQEQKPLPVGGKYSDIKLNNEYKTENFADKYPAGEHIMPMVNRLRELREQGATNIRQNGSTITYQTNPQYLQLSNKSLKHELQSRISSAISGSLPDSNIQTAITNFADVEGPGRNAEETKSRYWRRLQQAGLEYKKELGEKWEGGKEHDVYEGTNGNVIKVQYTIEPHEMLRYLKSLLVYNYFFPDTAYKLLGFINNDDKISPVVEQKAIVDNGENYNSSTVQKELSHYGFTRKNAYEFVNEETGIAIKDLHSGNVIFRDGLPQFIDPMLDISNHILYPSSDADFHETERTTPDIQLNNVLTDFVHKLQGEVRNVSSIVINGKTYNANAVTDILNKVISVVEGKAGLDTLPEEVGHLFVEYLPEGSLLLQQMMDDIVNRPIYDDVLQKYGDNPLYQNEDGSVNDDKIAREAVGKMIAKAITGKWQNQREKSTWTKFWDKVWKWFQGIVDTLRNKDTKADPYEQVAEEILRGETSSLDMEKYAEAEAKGMYYLELSKEHQQYLDEVKNNPAYTDAQRDTLEFVHERLHREIYQDFTDEKHDYVTLHQDPNDRTHYTSNTTAIYGNKELSGNAKIQGELSRQWGREADRIFNAIATGKDWETIQKEVDTPSFSPEVKKQVHDWGKNKIDQEISTDPDGHKDLFVSQSIARYLAANPENSIAASIDGLVIRPNGDIKRIIDFKTSIHSAKDTQNEYAVGEGSWLPKNTRLSKNEGYGLQLSAEQAMIEIEAAHYGKKIAFGTDDPDYEPLATYNLQWVIDPKDKSKIIGVKDDGINTVDVGTYRGLVDMLLHGAPVIEQKAWNPFAVPTTEELKETTSTMTAEEAEDYLATINKRLTSLDDILDQMEELTGTRKGTTVSAFGRTTANVFSKLLSDIQELRGKGEREKAIMRYVDGIRQFTKRYSDYVVKAENFSDPDYYKILSESIKMSNSNIDSIPHSLRELLSPDQIREIDAVHSSILALKTQNTLFANKYIRNIAESFVINDIIDRRTGKVIKTKDQQIDDMLYAPENDITQTSLMGDAIAEMTVPLLGQLHVIVQKAHLKHTLESNKLIDDIAAMGQEFEKATGLKLSDKAASDFLFHTDKDGTRTRFIDQIGDTYNKEKERLDALILDKDGKKMEPIPNPVTAKDRAYNNKLYAIKQQRSAFYKAYSVVPGYEETNDDGSISVTPPQLHDGAYHHLSPEYLTEINKVMTFAPHTKEQWLPKTGVSKNTETVADYKKWYEQNKDNITEKSEAGKWNQYWKAKVQLFRDKYQTWREFQTMEMVKRQDYDEEGHDLGTQSYQPSGKFIKDSGYFPSFQHILVNENHTELDENTGELKVIKSLQSKEYLRMKNGTTALEKAQYQFYTKFMEHMKDGVKQGGIQCDDWFRRGGLINLSNKFFKSAADKGIMNQIGHTATEWFSAIPDGTTKNTDETGVPRQELLVPYMADVRNVQKIKDIEQKLTDLESKKIADKAKGTFDFVAYDKEQRSLKMQLKAENHKTDAKDLEVDPIKLLSAFRVGTEKYAQFSAVEGKLLALRDIIAQEITNEKGEVKQFHRTGNLGQQLLRATGEGKEFVFKRKDEVNALKKANDYLRLFYGDTMSKTTMDVIADRIMNITSFGAMGFNYMGHFKNSILYQASNFRQNIAERFVTRRNYTKAQKEFFASFLPGMQTKLFEKKSGPFKAKSKMEWMMHHFGLDVDAQLKAQGKAQSGKFLDNSYMGENFAIHWAQYTMQSAYMRDQILNDTAGKPLKDKDGNNVSMYDAYMWNPNTGTCELRADAGHTMEQQHHIIVQAKDIQTKTQGNFDELNRPMIKNYLLGRMVSQFHNFFKTSWNDRFDKKYTHATLGEMEGTWRTVGSYIKLMREFEGHWNEKLKNGWNALSEHQQKNLKTDLWEMLMISSMLLMGAFIRSLGKGIPSSDPNKKKFTNFLAYTTNAVGKEQGALNPAFGIFNIKDLVSNPLALTPIVEGITTAVAATLVAPFQTEEQSHYQRGVFAGKSKAMEDWKKILPVTKQFHRAENFLQESEADYAEAKK